MRRHHFGRSPRPALQRSRWLPRFPRSCEGRSRAGCGRRNWSCDGSRLRARRLARARCRCRSSIPTRSGPRRPPWAAPRHGGNLRPDLQDYAADAFIEMRIPDGPRLERGLERETDHVCGMTPDARGERGANIRAASSGASSPNVPPCATMPAASRTLRRSGSGCCASAGSGLSARTQTATARDSAAASRMRSSIPSCDQPSPAAHHLPGPPPACALAAEAPGRPVSGTRASAGCGRADDAVPAERGFAFAGTVVGAPDREGRLTVSHDAVDRFMPAMVMPFETRGLPVGLANDDRIQATLVVTPIEAGSRASPSSGLRVGAKALDERPRLGLAPSSRTSACGTRTTRRSRFTASEGGWSS